MAGYRMAKRVVTPGNCWFYIVEISGELCSDKRVRILQLKASFESS